jgi:hypothetical protein
MSLGGRALKGTKANPKNVRLHCFNETIEKLMASLVPSAADCTTELRSELRALV